MSTLTPYYQTEWQLSAAAEPTVRRVAVTATKPAWWVGVTLAEAKLESATMPQDQASLLCEWTGMSQRALAAAIGTSHPTIKSVLSGQSTDFPKRPELRRRLSNLYGLCERLAPLAGHDQHLLLSLLKTEDGGRSLIEIAVSGEPVRAYSIALKRIAPNRDDGDFIESVYPISVGEATTLLTD